MLRFGYRVRLGVAGIVVVVIAVCGLLFVLTAPPLTFAQTQLAPSGVPGEVYYAAFPLTMQVDGNLSEWENVPQVTFVDGPQPAANPQQNGMVTFAAAADSDNLYFAFVVRDSSIIAGQHGQDYWNEDSVELYINATGNLSLTNFMPGVAQITIPAANIGTNAALTTGQNAAALGVRPVVVRTATGYAIEMAVPLRTSQWNIVPTDGGTLGFNVQLNGATQTDRDIKLSWSSDDQSSDQSYRNPSVFGQLVFFELGAADGLSALAAAPATQTRRPTQTPRPTQTLRPTQTPRPSSTPIGTAMVSSTPSRTPTRTQTPRPATIVPTSVGPSVPPGGSFRVDGQNIYDPVGNLFVVRGVNVNGLNWVWPRSTADDAALIDDCWNFNLIRVNSFLFTGQVEWPQFTDNNDLDEIVQAYTSRGIVVMFEAHDRTGWYYEGGDLTRLIQWYTDLARRYRNNPYVWFDVMNEPGYAVDRERWLGAHQQVIGAIRDTAGANNVIMVEGVYGGQDSGNWNSQNVQTANSAILSLGPEVLNFGGRTYGNIVFSIHTWDQWNYGSSKMANYFNRVEGQNQALVVGEYGVLTTVNTEAATRSLFNTAPSRNIGRIVWHWDGHDYNDLTDGSTWGGGWEIDSCTDPSNLSWLGQRVWDDNH
ncbi:MAG: cellulase family glycosylhydrolase [Burkholderiales bacterium]|nr:cellulase family glycosylhydrolase [Anaerolineae bacterium]